MEKNELSFDQLMKIYDHIGDEERHFNTLELEYRKLTSQWLLVSLGAIGFVLTKPEVVPVNTWALVIAICLAASLGILVIWFLDLKVYHEQLLPQIRNNMVSSQTGGDIIKRVVLYYFFSIALLFLIANIAVWMFDPVHLGWCIGTNSVSVFLLLFSYLAMTNKSIRHFD